MQSFLSISHTLAPQNFGVPRPLGLVLRNYLIILRNGFPRTVAKCITFWGRGDERKGDREAAR